MKLNNFSGNNKLAELSYNSINRFVLPVAVFLFVFLNLAMIQIKVEPQMLLLERFFANGGWFEAVIISIYGAILSFKMQDPPKVARWRTISWTIFMIWFFTQLILGVIVDERFLLTGKLHIPIPVMLISGPIFRGETSIMTILFLSTILLTGPAWCSHLCYFGAIDNLLSSNKNSDKSSINNKLPIKLAIISLVVLVTITLKWFNVATIYAIIVAISFGILGLSVSLYYSRKKGKMVHCSVYCPIGSIVNIFKFISPFRLSINSSCTSCMSCVPTCKYDALNAIDIERKRPGITCTLCGDCITSCHSKSIEYKFLGLSASKARMLYLFLTISTHSIFLAMGRI